MTVETPLGRVDVKPKRGRPFVVVGCGRDENQLRWYFDVHRRRVLKEAIHNSKALGLEGKPRPYWSSSYISFLYRAEAELQSVDTERDALLAKNRIEIEERHITVIGSYESREAAEDGVHRLQMRKEPTINCGWLNLHVVVLPESVNKRIAKRSAS